LFAEEFSHIAHKQPTPDTLPRQNRFVYATRTVKKIQARAPGTARHRRELKGNKSSPAFLKNAGGVNTVTFNVKVAK
jgi:hypothetical protein